MALAHHVTSNKEKLFVYFRAVLIGFSLVMPFAYVQFSYFELEMKPIFFLIPGLVAVLVSVLLAKFVLLQSDMEREHALFKAIADFSLEFKYIRSVKGDYQYVSPAVFSMTGYTQEAFYSQPNFMDQIIHPDDRDKWCGHVQDINQHSRSVNLEFRILTKSGQERWLAHLCGTVKDQKGQIVGVRATNIDITDRRKADVEFKKMGFYDPLTNLPNRRYIAEYMSNLISHERLDEPDNRFAVLFLDLNRFKYVNDAYGHTVGDELLRKVANRFQNSCLDSSKGVISRFGGDEFVIVKKENVSDEEIVHCVTTLRAILEKPFVVHAHSVNISASVGVARYPHDGLHSETLIKNADAAMFQAKNQGLPVKFFTQEMAEHASNMVGLQSRLKTAINDGMIQPYYQPLIDMKTGHMMGVEVLARWINLDAERSPSPAMFIPIAEETGLIWPLSESIISQAGQQIVRWQSLNLGLKYSINVSARQFADDDFCDQAINQFKGMGIEPQTVQIELTESVLLDNIERSIEKIQHLKSQGFSIALDDFGTGFASLHYLTMFPLDTIKVDKAFVENIIEDPRQYAIARSIINLAHDLDLVVVAEGIETEAQYQLLKELGCDIAQGFLFSRPVSSNDLQLEKGVPYPMCA
ncbi:MAG: EAL domain-containing protein [Thiotrichales bacterium]|nr:EAL domain-containing protein [Thiotrichales bacterium]